MGSCKNLNSSAPKRNYAFRNDCLAGKHKVNPVVKRRKKSDYKRYSKEVPGDRVQLDVTKIRNKVN